MGNIKRSILGDGTMFWIVISLIIMVVNLAFAIGEMITGQSFVKSAIFALIGFTLFNYELMQRNKKKGAEL